MRVMRPYLTLYGSNWRRRGRSPLNTGIISSYSRAARFERLRRRWLLPWRVLTSLPEPVYSKRRAAALWVFSLGIRARLSQEERRAHGSDPPRRVTRSRISHAGGGLPLHHPRLGHHGQPQDESRVAQPERARVRHFGVAVLAD